MNSLLQKIESSDVTHREKTRQLSSSLSAQEGLLKHLESALYQNMSQERLAALILENPVAAQGEVRYELDKILKTQRFSSYQQRSLRQASEMLLSHLFGLGPLENLLQDESVTEIMVNGAENIFYEREGKLKRSPSHFASNEEVRRVIDQIITPLGRRLDESTPVVNARLKEGHRVHAIIPPLSLSGPVLTIRKFQNDVFTLDSLAQKGSFPRPAVSFLKALVKARKNIAVSGGTGSGKTTFLNTLAQELSPQERIITIEDSAELRFGAHPHVVRLESRPANLDGEGAITLRDLVINSLRMRPDRIVVGEVRGQEALEMLQAMNTGHDGSMTTLHANSPREVAQRLVTMVGYGAQFSQEQILAQIASALDVIVHLERTPQGERRIKEIVLVNGVASGELLLKQVYRYEIDPAHLFVPEEFSQKLYEGNFASQEEAELWSF